MSLDIKVPSVGESITEVTIATWHKKDGDFVSTDTVLCELESDKATFELNAETSGILRIIAREGETVPIGALICKIEDSNGAQPTNSTAQNQKTPVQEETTTTAASPVAPAAETVPQPQAQAKAPDSSASTGAVVEMKVPAVGESIAEVTIGTWQKKDGDQVQVDEILCEIESDKATFELTAEAAGTLRIVAQQGETLTIGALICRIETAVTADLTVPQEPYAAPKEILQAENQQSDQPGNLDSNVKEAPVAGHYATGYASPSAAKILAEKGINTQEVPGTGPNGRVIKADAMNAQKPVAVGNGQPAVSNKAPETKPAPEAQKQQVEPTSDRNQSRQKMTSLRKTIARRLVAVKNETAMLTTFNEVDMKPIMDVRAKYKDKFKEKHNIGLGFMSFFAKACCVALQEWPAVNAMIDGDEMVFNNFCDVSIAVSTPKGLVVPVIRNAEQMSFAAIETEIIRLATRARDGKLTIEEMTGGTFTITNGGVFGSMMSTPIINAPQSAILGMHNIIERPVVVEGQIVVRPMMYVALSYDHRIIDGRESVSFLVRVKQLLEDPMRLLLDV